MAVVGAIAPAGPLCPSPAPAWVRKFQRFWSQKVGTTTQAAVWEHLSAFLEPDGEEPPLFTLEQVTAAAAWRFGIVKGTGEQRFFTVKTFASQCAAWVELAALPAEERRARRDALRASALGVRHG